MILYFCMLQKMRQNGAALTAACILLLFTFNYTLPLRKETLKSKKALYTNETKKCKGPFHRETLEKMNNMPADFQNVIRKIRNTTQLGANFSNKSLLSEEDIRQYEQLVIMKKYPYLDIKELEMKYSPNSNKEIRQSVKYHSRLNVPPESGICEPPEDTINVEIYNRGLSGFAIPTQLVKHKLKPDQDVVIKEKPEHQGNFAKTPSIDRNILTLLKDDISTFMHHKKSK